MKKFNVKKYVLAPLTAIVVLTLWFMPIEWFGIEGLTVIQQRTIAIFAYAALMWMFEIIPAWATSVTTIVFLLVAVSNKGFVTQMTDINPETGEKPSFGQLTQGNIAPHVEMIRVLATQFSAASGLSVTDTGVVSEANPTSADAVVAQGQTLIAMAEQLNVSNGNALRTIALMATAIQNNVTLKELTEEQQDIVAHFKNPALPSVAASADAAIKIASAREGFASTDTFLEMIGFDKADIRRIKAQEQRARGLQVLSEIGVEE